MGATGRSASKGLSSKRLRGGGGRGRGLKGAGGVKGLKCKGSDEGL